MTSRLAIDATPAEICEMAVALNARIEVLSKLIYARNTGHERLMRLTKARAHCIIMLNRLVKIEAVSDHLHNLDRE